MKKRIFSLLLLSVCVCGAWADDTGMGLELSAEKLKGLDPALLLRRGYSITLKDGRAIRDPHRLHQGDIVETRLEKGTIKSTVI